ncbi:hypothetical protein, partial [Bacteroides heparinolyticus]|uniref:hypothetical protein n=1 Tax=Prevotella heparinolytica TaxID=28113 RepID=UPI00359F3B84
NVASATFITADGSELTQAASIHKADKPAIIFLINISFLLYFKEKQNRITLHECRAPLLQFHCIAFAASLQYLCITTATLLQ